MNIIRAAALAAGLSALALTGGCANVKTAFDTVTGFHVTQSSVDLARASYDATFLTLATNYNERPRCAAGTGPTLANFCSQYSIVVKLRAADKAVETAFAAMQADLDACNTAGNQSACSGLSGAWAVLNASITAAKGIAASQGVS